jgi:hypothetical protein
MHNTTLLTTKKIHSSNYSDTLLLIFVVPIQNTKLVKVVYIVFRDNGKVSKTFPLKLPPYTKKKKTNPGYCSSPGTRRIEWVFTSISKNA